MSAGIGDIFVGAASPPGRKPYAPACMPCGLEAGLEAAAIKTLERILFVAESHSHKKMLLS